MISAPKSLGQQLSLQGLTPPRLNGTFLALAMVGLTLAGHDAGHAAIGFLSAALLFTSATLAPLVVERGGRLGLIGLAGWLLWVVWLVWYGVAFLADGGCAPLPSVQT